MATVERALLILRPPEEIWQVLAEFADISSWAPNVDHSCVLSDQTAGVGAIRRIQSGRATLVETVVEWEEGSRLSYSIGGLPPVIRAVTNTWSLEPNAAGTTVRLTSEIQPGPRPPHRLIATAVGRRLGAASDQMLGGLSVYLNGRASMMGSNI